MVHWCPRVCLKHRPSANKTRTLYSELQGHKAFSLHGSLSPQSGTGQLRNDEPSSYCKSQTSYEEAAGVQWWELNPPTPPVLRGVLCAELIGHLSQPQTFYAVTDLHYHRQFHGSKYGAGCTIKCSITRQIAKIPQTSP